MSKSTSRSLYGVSYIPYKPEKGKDKIRAPFVKAAFIDSLIRIVPDQIASLIFEKIKEKEKVPKEIIDYLANRDYAKLVSSAAKMDVKTIKKISTIYMDAVEHELKKALRTLKVKVNKLEKESSKSTEISKGKKSLRKKGKPPFLLKGPLELRALRMMMEEKRIEAELLKSFLPAGKVLRAFNNVSEIAIINFEQQKKQSEKSIEQLEEGIYAGVLFLERMDFTPVELVKGELIYTLPLVPGEKTTVSHKEWVKSVEEFEKELATLTEEEREEAKTERTELAESTTKDKKTEHKFDTGLKVKGGWGSWSIELSAGYSYDNLKTKHSEFSSKRNREITHRAASRSREEHKITFKISREAGREDERVRVIENNSDEVVRWDFYRMMRKWRIDLYRLGERLTFDLVIPEPGNYLLRRYLELLEIQEKIDRGLIFNLTPEDITEDNYFEIAKRYKVSLPPPPEKYLYKAFVDVLEDPRPPKDENVKTGVRTIEIKFPEGYKITEIHIIDPPNGVYFNKHKDVGEECLNKYNDNDPKSIDDVRRCIGKSYGVMEEILYYRALTNKEDITQLETNEGKWVWEYFIGKVATGDEYDETAPHFIFRVTAERKDELLKQWQMECFEKIKEAAREQWLQELEGLENQRDRLIAELTGKDALKLRQIEKEEIMKTVLRWLLGPDFEYFPEELENSDAYSPRDAILEWHLRRSFGFSPEELSKGSVSSTEELEDLPYYEGKTSKEEKLMKMDEETRKRMLKYLKIVRFIQQAIEWENVNWILYPYFWTVPERWDFKQSLEHPDFYHRAFLRAGCTRVILTVRPGFEEAFVRFMETGGKIDGEIDEDHPYLTLAQEIKANSKTTYKYTPNPNRGDYVFCWNDVPGADERRLKEHLKNIGGVILRDLIKDLAKDSIKWEDLSEKIENQNIWGNITDEAEINKSEDKKTITVTLKIKEILETLKTLGTPLKAPNTDVNLILKFELDSKSGIIKLLRNEMSRRGDVLLSGKEKVLPLRYYSSKEEEERYVFFIPGEHIDTWYEYTPTGALHVEKGGKLSTW